MKLTKKKVFVVAIALSLVAIISMGSLAWFFDSEKVENNFMIADSDHDSADELFSIDVWEITPADDTAHDEDGYQYDDVLPGDELTKDVFVKNTGYYDQYVRVIVTVSDAQEWINILGADFQNFTDIFVGFDSSLWVDAYTNLTDDPNAENLVYVLYYNGILEEGDVINVFDAIKIPEDFDQEDLAQLGNQFSITVKAQAVQTKNLGAETPEIDDGVQKSAAWTAFKNAEFSIAD